MCVAVGALQFLSMGCALPGQRSGDRLADAFTLAFVQEPRSDSTHAFLDTEKDALKAVNRGTLSLNQAS